MVVVPDLLSPEAVAARIQAVEDGVHDLEARMRELEGQRLAASVAGEGDLFERISDVLAGARRRIGDAGVFGH
jgi:hypothetical protein